MSSSTSTHQQLFADVGFETHPSMLERGPYQMKIIQPDPNKEERPKTIDDLTGDDLKQYEADIEEMHLILISILNKIYNSGTKLSEIDRETRFNNEFDQFPAAPEESITSVYNRFSQLINDLKRNNVTLSNVTINTKFLNCLQPKWYKYVTNVCLAKNVRHDPFDMLFNHLQEYEKLVIAYRVRKTVKTHDPLALVAHTSSSSQSPPPYYVTHPPSMVDYDDDYQGDTFSDDQEDILTFAMKLLVHVITQQESTKSSNVQKETRNVKRTLRTSSSGNATNIRCYNYSAKGHYAHDFPKPKVRDSKYFLEQMLLAKKDEARVILSNEQNDFLLNDATQMEEIEELSVNICMIARIQQTTTNSDEGLSCDSAYISEVQTISTSFINLLFSNSDHEQTYHEQPKIINSTNGDDQINSDIIFNDPTVEVNDRKYILYNHEDTISSQFYYDEVKPIVDYLHTVLKSIQTEFPEEVKVMMDVFDLMESDLDKTMRQNEILNDRLLEAILKHDVESCVLMCSDSMNDNLKDEIEKDKRDSIYVQDNLLKQIKILEIFFKDVKNNALILNSN
ncbi:hypothetical protein Tco_0087296 [Tanacetum coccineum]